MISIQRILGRPQDFFGLLAKSAAIGTTCAKCLSETLLVTSTEPTTTAIATLRRQEKEITNSLEYLLTSVGVTPIEREDLSDVAAGLYKFPKGIEAVIERFVIGYQQIKGTDFSEVTRYVEQAARLVEEMVSVLSSNGRLLDCKVIEGRLSQLEADANHVALRQVAELYKPGVPVLKAIIAKDIYDRLLEAIDICRNAGRTIALVVMKNS